MFSSECCNLVNLRLFNFFIRIMAPNTHLNQREPSSTYNNLRTRGFNKTSVQRHRKSQAIYYVKIYKKECFQTTHCQSLQVSPISRDTPAWVVRLLENTIHNLFDRILFFHLKLLMLPFE